MSAIAAVVAGAALLLWPSLLNGYPLVFIDTASYLMHTVEPAVPWDKTQAYGPFLHLFHWRVSLWPPMVAQGLIASHLIWLAVRAIRGEARPLVHLAVCSALGALTSAPWFLATLMPDAFTALAPLTLFLLGFGRLGRSETAWVIAVGTLAVATHLSHLPVALGLVVLTLILTRRAAPVLRAAIPVALAVGFLLTSNALAFGRATLSPHGAVFLLARLQADGPAARLLRDRCPEAGWHLCAFTDRLPMDSDEFLWDGSSPLNREADGTYRAMGGVRGAAEAAEINRATLRAYPAEVAGAVLTNTLRQLGMTRVGDTLSDEHLAASARRYIAGFFQARELAAFDAGAQMRGELQVLAAPFLLPHLPVLLLSLAGAGVALWRATRARDFTRATLIIFALAALAGNAAIAGGLSKPHHRYQARIVWLLPLAVMVSLWPPSPASRRKGEGTARPMASVEKPLLHHLFVPHRVQPHFLHLNALAGLLVCHVHVEDQREAVAIHERAGGRRRVDVMVRIPPVALALHCRAAAQLGHVALHRLAADDVVRPETRPGLFMLAGLAERGEGFGDLAGRHATPPEHVDGVILHRSDALRHPARGVAQALISVAMSGQRSSRSITTWPNTSPSCSGSSCAPSAV